MTNPIIRRNFPKRMKSIHYDPVDWEPTYRELYECMSKKRTIRLQNKTTGEIELHEFCITGSIGGEEENPDALIYGKILTDDPYEYDLAFDYSNYRLNDIFTTPNGQKMLLDKFFEYAQKTNYKKRPPIKIYRIEEEVIRKPARTEVFYLDDKHIIVSPAKATIIVITEYDEDGNMIRETWGRSSRKHSGREPRIEWYLLKQLCRWIKMSFIQRRRTDQKEI